MRAPCTECDGEGFIDLGPDSSVHTCDRCGGTGKDPMPTLLGRTLDWTLRSDDDIKIGTWSSANGHVALRAHRYLREDEVPAWVLDASLYGPYASGNLLASIFKISGRGSTFVEAEEQLRQRLKALALDVMRLL